MAELNFEIHHAKHETISASTYRDALHHAVGLLGEYDTAISGKPHGSLSWYIGKLHSNGSLMVSFRSRLKPVKRAKDRLPDIGPRVANSLLIGFEDLEEKCLTPPYLSEFGMRKAGELTDLIGKNGATGFRFSSASKSIEVTQQTSENINKLLPIKRTAVGSVEGRLEGINLHRKPRVTVYHSLSKKGVVCEFDPDTFMDQVKKSLGERVLVVGILHKNINGDTLRVTMDQLRIVDESKRFGISEFEDWPDPEFASAKSTADYIRSIRGGG